MTTLQRWSDTVKLIDLIVIFLAGMQIVELYRHGSLFGQGGALPLRWWAENKAREEEVQSPLDDADRVKRHLARFLLCPFCEAPWACLATATMWLWGGPVGQLVVLALAASRLANLTNDLTHDWSRSPSDEEDHQSGEELEISETVD